MINAQNYREGQKMRLPRLKNSSNEVTQTAADNNHSDVLQLFGIPATTTLDDDVLTVAEIDAVTYRPSRPQGYYPGDVDAFHERTRATVEKLRAALHKRDQDVYKLATEYDAQQATIEHLRMENQVFHARGAILVNDDGTPATPDSDAAVALRLAEEKKALEEQIQALNEWAEQVQEQYSLLVEENENLTQQLAQQATITPSPQTHFEETAPDEEPVTTGDSSDDYVPVETPQPEAAPDPSPTHHKPQIEFDEYGNKYIDGHLLHEDIEYQETDEEVNLYAPELPPGVILPSQQFQATRQELKKFDPTAPLEHTKEGEY